MFHIVKFLIIIAMPSFGLSFANVNVAAVGSTPTSAAAAGASAFGATAAGQATIGVTPNSAFASASAVATGPFLGTTHKPPTKVHPRPPTIVKHHPTPTPKHHPAPIKKVIVTPKCDDIHDCYDIDNKNHCGYCVLEKYPTKGKGCAYDSDYTPKCECKGVFIHDKHACPSCESVLEELLECAKVKDTKDRVEIPSSCLGKVKVTVEYLEKCGYIQHPETTKKIVVPPPTHSKKTPIVIVRPTYPTGKTHYHPTTPVSGSAFASASATAGTAGGISVASADATAIATGSGSAAAAGANALAVGAGSLASAVA